MKLFPQTTLNRIKVTFMKIRKEVQYFLTFMTVPLIGFDLISTS